MTLIPDSAVPFIVLPAVLLITWYGIKAQAQAIVTAPPSPPRKPSRFQKFCGEVWEWVEVCFVIAGFVLVGLVLLALIAFSFTLDFTIAPTTVIAFLLFLILFKMERK